MNSIISKKVTNLKANANTLKKKLIENGLEVESILMTKNLSTTFNTGTSVTNEDTKSTKAPVLSWGYIVLIAAAIFFVIISIFVIYKNEKAKCVIRAAIKAEEDKKKFVTMKTFENPLRRQSQVNSFLEKTGGALGASSKDADY